MRRRPGALVAALVGSMLLAACTGPATTRDIDGPDRDATLFSAREGGIRGVVTDVELRPLEGARATLEADGRHALAEAGGGFAFPLVAPGEQRILVEALGHFPQTVTTTVRAGDVSQIQVALEPAPIKEPYVQILPFRGFVVCDANAVLVVYSPPTVPGCDQREAVFVIDVADSWQYLMVEAQWRNPEAMHLVSDTDTLCFFGTASDNPCFNWATERSPIRFDGRPNTTWALAPPDFVYPPEAFRWVLFSSGAGLVQEEIAASPACTTFRPNGPDCGGVGASLGFAYDLYASIFHHEETHTMETFSAFPDS